MKVNLFDKALVKEFLAFLSTVEFILALVLIFLDIPQSARIVLGGIFIGILVCIYLLLWRRASKLESIQVHINNSVVNVEIGDIFDYKELKVIAFNEYFDTIVDDKIISNNSLNGIFINSKIDDISTLDSAIANDTVLQQKVVEENKSRQKGKTTRYSLGACYLHDNEYVLTAFSRFSIDNRAFLTMGDFLQFLVAFWSEIDGLKSGRSVVIPLLGSRMVRFRGYENITDQELLEMLVWSFKISRVKFAYPFSVTFVIHKDHKHNIDLYKIKRSEKYGI